MKRRRFITLGAAAGIGTPLLRVPTTGTQQQSDWRPDGVGSVARIGVLTPDFDPVPESEMAAMAPHGVSIHAARVPRPASDVFACRNAPTGRPCLWTLPRRASAR